MHKYLGGLTVGFVVAYLVVATLDAKYGVTYQLAQKLPLPAAA